MCMLQLHLTFGPQPIAQIYLSIHAVLAAHEAARGLCLYPIVVAAELLILVRLQAISLSPDLGLIWRDVVCVGVHAVMELVQPICYRTSPH